MARLGPRAARVAGVHLAHVTTAAPGGGGWSSSGSACWSGARRQTWPIPTGPDSGPRSAYEIAGEAPQPVRDSWWLPYWKPVWGHPRVALGGLMVSGLALCPWCSWPGAPATLAAPVTVQDVSSADPDRSVMVYSSPDDDVTVIWVFNPADGRRPTRSPLHAPGFPARFLQAGQPLLRERRLFRLREVLHQVLQPRLGERSLLELHERERFLVERGRHLLPRG